ncbi:MAG: hypothetical protein GC151_06530 [Betaproteobacteria bacterium]|nr:hypothetical protein [Betaproteobacteria bacterium]
MLPLPTSDPTNPDPDVWLRTEVVVLTLKDTSTNTIFPGQYIRSISGTNPDIYWRIDLTGFGTPQAVSTPVPGVFIQETPTGEKRRALVQVDTTTGTIIGFKWETKAGQKITKSCWTSFRP